MCLSLSFGTIQQEPVYCHDVCDTDQLNVAKEKWSLFTTIEYSLFYRHFIICFVHFLLHNAPSAVTAKTLNPHNSNRFIQSQTKGKIKSAERRAGELDVWVL